MTWVIILKNKIFFYFYEKEGRERERKRRKREKKEKKEKKRLSTSFYILASTVSFSALCAFATLFRAVSVATELELALGVDKARR